MTEAVVVTEAMIQAAWENLPSPYEIDVGDREAMETCLRAALSAAPSQPVAVPTREEVEAEGRNEPEPAAWRLRRVGSERYWNLWDLDPRVDNPAYADVTAWDVQPLYTRPDTEAHGEALFSAAMDMAKNYGLGTPESRAIVTALEHARAVTSRTAAPDQSEALRIAREALEAWITYDEGTDESGVDIMLAYNDALTKSHEALSRLSALGGE